MTALKLPSLPFALEPAGSPPPGCRVRSGVLTLTRGGAHGHVRRSGGDRAGAGRRAVRGAAAGRRLHARGAGERGVREHVRRRGPAAPRGRTGLGQALLRVFAAAQAHRGHRGDQGDLGRLQLLRGGRQTRCGCGSRGPGRPGRSTRPPTARGGGCCATSPSAWSWSGSASWPSPPPGPGARRRSTASRSGPGRRRTCATGVRSGKAAAGGEGGEGGGQPEFGGVQGGVGEPVHPGLVVDDNGAARLEQLLRVGRDAAALTVRAAVQHQQGREVKVNGIDRAADNGYLYR